jgi:hypothetical protein
VKPRLKGHAFLIRYADDFVIGCADETDARRLLEVLPKRFAKYGLTLHAEKTRLVPFRRPPRRPTGGGPQAGGQPGTFDLLGFRHCWVRSRRGNWVVRQETAPSRFRAALRRIAAWCRAFRHEPVAEQHRTLWQKLKGHFGYCGSGGNGCHVGTGVASCRGTALRRCCSGIRCRRPSWSTPCAGRSEAVTDEPDALKAHVRICGSPGWATARGDPAERRALALGSTVPRRVSLRVRRRQ